MMSENKKLHATNQSGGSDTVGFAIGLSLLYLYFAGALQWLYRRYAGSLRM